MIRVFALTRTCAFSKSTEYMSVVGGCTPRFSNWIVTVTTEPKGTSVKFNLFKLKLFEELLYYVISPVITTRRPLDGDMTIVFYTLSGYSLEGRPNLIPILCERRVSLTPQVYDD